MVAREKDSRAQALQGHGPQRAQSPLVQGLTYINLISVSFVWTDENENLEEYETKIIFYLNILDDNDRKAFSL